MANLLFVYPRKMATTEGMYEIYTSKEAREHGLNARFINIWDINSELLNSADTIIFVRSLDLLSQWILKEAQKKGLFIVQFFDDDLLNLPRSSVNRVQFLPWRKRAIREGFRYTDVILSSNRMLAEKYAKMTQSGRFAAMDTIVSPESLIPMEIWESFYRDDKVRIVFAAGANHEGIFHELITPILPELANRYGKKLSFTFFGVRPDLSFCEGKIEAEYVGSMSLPEYRKAIQKGKYDIGIAPLEQNDFSKYKYFNKYIEYTIAGTPGIYSNVPPYTLVIKDKENGFLADNTSEEWLKAFVLAIDHVQLRRNCYRNAYKHILTYMNSDSIFERLVADIPELIEHREKKGSVFTGVIKARFLLIRFIECIYLICEYIKLTGVSGTVRKIRSYIEDQKEARLEKLGE